MASSTASSDDFVLKPRRPPGLRSQKRSIEEIKIEPQSSSDFSEGDDDPLLLSIATNVKREKNTSSDNEPKRSKQNKDKGIKKPKLKKPSCLKGCKDDCRANFDSKERKRVYDKFWTMDSVAQLGFMQKAVTIQKSKKIRLAGAKRPRKGYSCRYSLWKNDEEKRSVCSKFFTTTLALKPDKLKEMLKTVAANAAKLATDQARELPVDEATIVAAMTPEITLTETTANETPGNVAVEQPKKPRKKIDASHKMRPAECQIVRCRFDCTSKISEEQRTQLWTAYWQLDFKRRKDYLIAHVESNPLRSRTADEFRQRRERSHQNHFFLRNEKGEKMRVCSSFFQTTLGIGSNYVGRTLRKSDPKTGTYIGDDKRGHHEPSNKTKPEMREEVKRHIASYPTWSPNKRSKTRYLHSSLSVKGMFRAYKEKCIAEGRKFVNTQYFRDVFRDEFQLAFLRPTGKNPHAIGAVKRKTKTKDSEESSTPKKFKLHNPLISEYTGEEGGGFWSSGVSDLSASTVVKTDNSAIGFNATTAPYQPNLSQASTELPTTSAAAAAASSYLPMYAQQHGFQQAQNAPMSTTQTPHIQHMQLLRPHYDEQGNSYFRLM